MALPVTATTNTNLIEYPEKRFSEIVENARPGEVERWLRPATKQFNIWYKNNSERYVPDFVVETADTIYLIEIKAENEMEDRIVQMKAKTASNYCQTASEINAVRNEKPWKYALIHTIKQTPIWILTVGNVVWEEHSRGDCLNGVISMFKGGINQL